MAVPANPLLKDAFLTGSLTGLLVLVSLVLIRSHFKSWKRHQAGADADPGSRLHYHGQFRRRMQASSLLGVLGVLIGVGSLLIPWQQAPKLFSVYWILTLLLTLWVILLAVADAIATFAYRRAAIARMRAQRRQLQRYAAELGENALPDELPVD